MRGPQGPFGSETPGEGLPVSPQVLDVVLGLYRAAMQPDAATAMMILTAPLFGTTKAMYIRLNRMRPSESVTELIGVSPEFAARMKNRKLDEDRNVWRSVFAVPAGGIFMSSELIPREELTARPRYSEVIVAGGLDYAISGILENDPVFFSNISFMSPEDFTSAHKRTLELLLPHLQTALRLSERIAAADAGRREALASFDRANQPVVFLDRSGYAIHCNGIAERVLKNADGLTLKFGRFLFENVTTQTEFERAVRVATASIGSDIPALPYKIRVMRRSAGSPYALAVIPVHASSDRVLLPDGAACIILIHDLERVEELPAERLAWLYKLTPAETRICESLYRTGSIDSAAEDLHLTRNTVRSHLKSIYGKFGVATQGQLMQRLANAPALTRGYVRNRFGSS